MLTSAILEFDDGVATFTCSTRAEPDQRVHVYGTEGRISIGIPFNIPPDRPTESRSSPRAAIRPSHPTPETLTFAAGGPVHGPGGAVRGRGARRPSRVPIPPEDAVGNLRVIEALFRVGAVEA